MPSLPSAIVIAIVSRAGAFLAETGLTRVGTKARTIVSRSFERIFSQGGGSLHDGTENDSLPRQWAEGGWPG
jgi:hypothetical protein